MVFLDPYKFVWKEFGPCAKEKRGADEYQVNVLLRKNEHGMSELVGNLTILVPFDDSFTVCINIFFHYFATLLITEKKNLLNVDLDQS